MIDYTTAACSSCRQSLYMERRRLEAPVWSCPACGHPNASIIGKEHDFVPGAATKAAQSSAPPERPRATWRREAPAAEAPRYQAG